MVPYDRFIEAFLAKITDYDYALLEEYQQYGMADMFLRSAFARFARLCRYDLTEAALDDNERVLLTEIPDRDIGEIVHIIALGMVSAWTSTYLHRQENLQNVLNTTDFSGYSPAELTKQVRAVHERASIDFALAMRQYGYDNADMGRFVVS